MNTSTQTMTQRVRWSMYGLLLSLSVWGCGTSSFQANENSWKTYKNPRYGFEFPYPSSWQEVKPDNNDGIMFLSPQKSSVQIRGWAGNQLFSPSSVDSKAKKSVNSNFKNVQGISGVMTVEIGQKESMITLKFNQGQVKYYWQGKAPSEDFDDYYRYFYYIAQNYRLPR